jgi:O-antigen/teichoic acid export membrane protein
MDSSKRPSSLLSNVFSSGLVRVFRAVIQLFLTPIVIALLGPEQYGIVAFSLTMQVLFFMLDQAVSPVIIRYFAIYHEDPSRAQDMHNMLKTFEILSLVLGFVVCLLIIIAAPYIASDWLKPDTLDLEYITVALQLIGVMLLFQWPALLYSGCFIGLRKQNYHAGITIMATLIHVPILISVLYFWKADVLYYLGLQAIFSLVTSFVMRLYVKRAMPLPHARPVFRVEILKKVSGYAGGTFLIGITTAVLTQLDKLFISGAVSLDIFTIYALSFTVVLQVMLIVSSPLMASAQPVMSSVISSNDSERISRHYHLFSQANSVIVFSALGTLFAFALPLLKLWLGEESPIVNDMADLLPWIILGSILNALHSMPYITQMAAGWTRLKLSMNLFQVVIYLIFLPSLFEDYGVFAGVMLWIFINLLNFLVEVPLMHRRLLQNELYRWWFSDTVFPAVIATMIFFISTEMLGVFETTWLMLVQIVMTVFFAIVGMLSTLPLLRKTLLQFIKHRLSYRSSV